MSLREYHRKRTFGTTPEPRGHRSTGRGPLRFVVQKHQARRLHYDFRLELDGVLKSWAVPKGPSLNPQDKRLAVMVEDHPFDYRTFEGTIAPGNYGAGTVMVWDQGTYGPPGVTDRKEAEAVLREGLERGHLRFVLNGNKLQGEFTLLRIKRGKGDTWLLIKKADAHATRTDITQEDRSATSGRSLDEIADAKPARRRSAPPKKPAPMPHQVKPMLATPVEHPFHRAGWLFEVKWDGYRAIAEVKKGKVALYSRNHKSFAERFAPVVASLQHLGHDAVLDGEVVAVDDEGRSQFQLLQNYQKTGEGRLVYYVFDLLYLDGEDLRALPLRRRKEMLAALIHDLPHVALSEHVEDDGVAFFHAVAARGLEGIIAKDADSPYRDGVRGPEWLKIKTHLRQEAVIGGFTEPRGSRQQLGALVLGVYEGDDLVYVGHTGGGFNDAGLADMRARLEPLVRRTCPFRKQPKTNAPVHWVEPRLVCEVSFQEWTRDGSMRFPIFVGLREDKPARAVRRELPQQVDGQSPAETPRVAPKLMTPSHARRRARTTKKSAAQKDPPLTNLEKVYWPDDGYTKGDLIAYYREVASILLPYLRDRPESLHRHPNGIGKPGFFQKDVGRQPPPGWVETVAIPSESQGKGVRYLLCQDEPSLLYLANLGCIELNPWNARVGHLDTPDYLIIDLDPEALSFDKVIEAARAVHEVLDQAGAECLCKTSGKRGLHIVVPLGGKYTHDQARQFAEIVAGLVHRRLPGSTSLLRSPSQRQRRVYLDYLQNRIGQTLAAPYSVRPYPGATVSTPLKWSEVRRGLDPSRFTIKTLPARLAKTGDLWTAALGPGIDLAACLNRLN